MQKGKIVPPKQQALTGFAINIVQCFIEIYVVKNIPKLRYQLPQGHTILVYQRKEGTFCVV